MTIRSLRYSLLTTVCIASFAAGCVFDDDDKGGKTTPPVVAGGRIVIATSDYISGDTAIYTLDDSTLTDNVLPHFQDVSLVADGSDAYFLERMGADTVIKFANGVIAPNAQAYQYSAGPNANPSNLVFWEGKGYLLRYNSPTIWVVNPVAGSLGAFKTAEIDLSAWADSDGSPEPTIGFVHDDRVYIVLQRYDLTTYTAGTSVLVAIDPATDTLIDLDPSVAGIQGVDLLVKNVITGALYGSTLYLGGSTYGDSDEGIIAVNLDSPRAQHRVLDEAALGGQISQIAIFPDGTGIIIVAGAWPAADPWLFNPADGAKGAKLPVPVATCVAKAGNRYYIGSGAYDAPGVYIVDAATKTLVGDVLPTSLPPYRMIYLEQ